MLGHQENQQMAFDTLCVGIDQVSSNKIKDGATRFLQMRFTQKQFSRTNFPKFGIFKLFAILSRFEK